MGIETFACSVIQRSNRSCILDVIVEDSLRPCHIGELAQKIEKTKGRGV